MSVPSRVPGPPARRSVLRTVAAVAALVGGLLLAAAGPAAAEPGFGTAPVAQEPPGTAAVAAISTVTVGRHAGFDRVVFRVSGPTLGYQVRYVDRLVEDPTGTALPLAGSAVLQVTLRQTDWTERPSPRLNRSPGLPALRQVRSAGEFEGVAVFGIGQATRAGFQVFRLTGPDRIVVDVRHPRVSATTSPAGPPTGAASPAAGGTGVSSGIGDTPAPADGELAGTGAGTDPVTLAILGGLLALAGLVAVGVGVHITRRPAG
jgi:hypothetical protein